MNRVCVTGMGAITPLGNTVGEFWKNLIAGKHGFAPITKFDTAEHKVKLAAEVKDFTPENYMDKKEARRMDIYCQYIMAASKLCVEDSGLDVAAIDPWRAGVIISSGVGGLGTMETEHGKLTEKGPGRVSPLFIPMMIANIAPGMVAMVYGFKGINYCPVTACAGGTHAIGEAFRAIKHGYADIMLAGGGEAVITPLAAAGFANMTALNLTEDSDMASLPFSKDRNGFVMGEGGGVLMLENLDTAKARGAHIYAEIAGYGATADAYHITSPDPQGLSDAKAMELAMAEAGLSPADIDYINAHGTGTELNDRFETMAIKLAFGEHARAVSISSTKSMTGHLLGAAGAIEAIVLAKAIEDDIIPPTINLNNPDPECDLDYTPNRAVKKTVNAAISNNLGFGGHNACILMRKI